MGTGSKTTSRKFSALIVDDEPIARQNLRALLSQDPEVEIVGEAGSGARAIRMLQANPPDLLFLDIQMPEMSGFEVLKRIDLARIPAIIFVTAYDQYALQAFEVQALDYLLKPFDDERFARTLKRAKEQIEQRHAAALKQRLVALLEGEEKSVPARQKPVYTEKFLVRSASRVLFVRVDEIDWIEAADYYACLHVGAQSHMLRETMAALEAQLDPERFLRIHRSTIVNLSRVREVRLQAGGEYAVMLEDGRLLRLSRSRHEQLERLLKSAT